MREPQKIYDLPEPAPGEKAWSREHPYLVDRNAVEGMMTEGLFSAINDGRAHFGTSEDVQAMQQRLKKFESGELTRTYAVAPAKPIEMSMREACASGGDELLDRIARDEIRITEL